MSSEPRFSFIKCNMTQKYVIWYTFLIEYMCQFKVLMNITEHS